MESRSVELGGFRVPLDRFYHPQDHVWVRREGDRVRVGMDPLGQETAGDVASLVLLPPGTEIRIGDELGTLEAQKYVGALRAPVSGTVLEVNDRVLASPRLVNSDPTGEGWLAVLAPTERLDEELAGLVSGEAIAPWFLGEIEDYRAKGVLAE